MKFAPGDLRTETVSSPKGWAAVRVTHLPSGVSAERERSDELTSAVAAQQQCVDELVDRLGDATEQTTDDPLAKGMRRHAFGVHTGDRLVTDITDPIERFCRGAGDGLVHVFVPHATAGVALIELGSGTEADLQHAMDRLLPRNEAYLHRHGSPGHGADHVMPAFVSPSLVLAVDGGTLDLGTWQRIALVDPNVDNPDREVRLHFLPA